MKKTNILRLCVVIMALTTLLTAIMMFPKLMGTITEAPPIILVIQLGFYLRLIPFLIGLYQVWNILVLLKKGHAFSIGVINGLRNIKYCAASILIIYLIGMGILSINDMANIASMINAGEVAFKAGTLLLFSGVFQELIQKAYDIKIENDLTV